MLLTRRSLRWLLTSACLPFMLTTTTLTTTGCPGDGDGDGDGDAGVEVEPGERLATAFSEFYARCFFSTELYAVIEPGTNAETFNGTTADDYRQWLEAQINNENVNVNEEAAIACATYYEELNQGDSCFAATDDAVQEACNTAISGTIERGGECVWSTECVSQYCDVDENGCGTCTTFAGEGESCAELDCDYNLDLSCNDNDICVAPLGEGEACTDENYAYLGDCDWQAGLVCNYQTYLCVVGAAAGESCSYTGCAADLYCDDNLEEPICVEEATIEPPADGTYDEGDACTAQDYDGCSAIQTALACVDDNQDGEGVCTPIVAAAEGEACDTNAQNLQSERWCLHALTTHYCAPDPDGDGIAGTCQPRPTEGESCNEAPCDNTTACIYDDVTFDGTCQALPAAGEPCLDGWCGEGAYCLGEDQELGEPGTCVEQVGLFDPPMCMADGT